MALGTIALRMAQMWPLPTGGEDWAASQLAGTRARGAEFEDFCILAITFGVEHPP